METTEEKILKMLPILNEKQKRIYLATEALALGYGGIKKISKISKVSENTISAGVKEIQKGIDPADYRIRKIGGGRKSVVSQIGNIKEEIEKLVAGNTYGNPENPLLYTTKSLRKLEKALKEKGIIVSHSVIGDILKDLGYSLQLNKKCLQIGEQHPDRNQQFEYINNKAKEFIEKNEPVISVDTKKKELIGNFKNNGSEYRKEGEPLEVLDHDFMIEELGKVAPYGIYDIDKNVGFINLGTSKDTAEFAVESILRWWQTLGRNTYPQATKLYINADSGGSNSSRGKLWKKQLQDFSNIARLEIHISHFPPGTSKWNKIEHKMFCFISKNWRGQPLVSVETVVSLISNTTTEKGLTIKCIVDNNEYKLGKTVSKKEMNNINIIKDNFHGDWNYVIYPNIKETKVI